MLKERIEHLKNRVDGPYILTPKGYSVSDMHRCIGSFLSTLSSIIRKEATLGSIVSTDREIQLYLWNLNQIHKSLTRSDSEIYNNENINKSDNNDKI